MSESPTLGYLVRARRAERKALQRDVDEFHANGGKTQYLQPGEASDCEVVEHDGKLNFRRKPQ